MEARTLDCGGIGWAVRAMRGGHRLRRAGWPPGVWLAYRSPVTRPDAPASALLPNVLQLHDGDDGDDGGGPVGPYPLTLPDLMAKDWEMVP